MVTIPTIDQISGTTVMNKMRSLIHAFIDFAGEVDTSFDDVISQIQGMTDLFYTKGEIGVILNNYYTKTQIDDMIATVESHIPDVSSYATRTWVYDNFYTRTQIDNTFRLYYTSEEVDDLIAAIPAPDMSNYYTKTEVDAITNTLCTESEANNIALAVFSTSISNYYTKAQVDALIPSMNNYYTKSEVDNLIPDMSNYYTKAQVDALIPSMNNYYTKSEVDNLIPNMSNYYTKTQVDALIPSMNNYYTKTEVDNLIPNMNNYYTKTEVYTKSEVDALISGSGGGYAPNYSRNVNSSNYQDVIMESATGIRFIRTVFIDLSSYGLTPLTSGYGYGTNVGFVIIPKGAFYQNAHILNFKQIITPSQDDTGFVVQLFFIAVSNIITNIGYVNVKTTTFTIDTTNNTIANTSSTGSSTYNMKYDPNEPVWVQP